MKTLIIYYSFEGNCELIARSLASRLHADLLRLRCGNEPSPGPLKYLIGGREALRGTRANLYRIDTDLDEYDFIVIGGPVWAGTMPPALREFVTQHPFEHKRTAVFASSNSGNAAGMLKRLRAMLAGNEVIAEMSFKRPLKDPNQTSEKIGAFIKQMQNGLGHSEDVAYQKADLAADQMVRQVSDELAAVVAKEMKKRKGKR